MDIREYSSYEESCVVIGLITQALDKIALGRYSAVLVNQLAYIPYAGMAELYQFVIPEIEHLENPKLPTKTPKETRFKRSPMEGLKKKHFYIPPFAGQNMLNIWGMDSKSTEFEDKFKKRYSAFLSAPNVEKAKALSAQISQEMMEKFDRTIKTGEYIVFQKYNNHNYYLCLAKHQQDNDTLNWVKAARKDFPFLAGN